MPVIDAEDINAPAVVERIRHLHPDLIVVVGWTRLLSPALLSVPSRGCIGFHASLLPRYRGRAPVNWAILRGETFTGNTMFMLTPEADTGDIVDQRVIAIGDEDTCGDVYAKVGAVGADMLRTHLQALRGHRTAPAPGARRHRVVAEAHTGNGHHRVGSPRARGARLDPSAHPAVPGGLQPARRTEGHVLALHGSRS